MHNSPLRPPEIPSSQQFRVRPGRIVKVYPEVNQADIVLEKGDTLSRVPVIGDLSGTRAGSTGMPPVDTNPDRDPYSLERDDDTRVIVGFVNGKFFRPIAWVLPPAHHERSFLDPSMSLRRGSDDSYELSYADDDPDAEELQRRRQDGDRRRFPRESSRERVFPDASWNEWVDAPEQGERDLILRTYDKVGRDWSGPVRVCAGEEPVPDVAPDEHGQLRRRRLGDEDGGDHNVDCERWPWQVELEPDAPDARGYRINQRWGSYFEVDRAGDIFLSAEGINELVYPLILMEPNAEAGIHPWIEPGEQPDLNRGELTLSARTRLLARAKESWRWLRKRARVGGRRETREGQELTLGRGQETSDSDVRRWGGDHVRAQREVTLGSRKDMSLAARDHVVIRSGRNALTWGPDAERYQDDAAWRNPDSDELGNILIESIRPPLDDFGRDGETRDRDTGGAIQIRSVPVEGRGGGVVLEVESEGDGSVRIASLSSEDSTARVIIEAVGSEKTARITLHGDGTIELSGRLVVNGQQLGEET